MGAIHLTPIALTSNADEMSDPSGTPTPPTTDPKLDASPKPVTSVGTGSQVAIPSWKRYLAIVAFMLAILLITTWTQNVRAARDKRQIMTQWVETLAIALAPDTIRGDALSLKRLCTQLTSHGRIKQVAIATPDGKSLIANSGDQPAMPISLPKQGAPIVDEASADLRFTHFIETAPGSENHVAILYVVLNRD